MPQPSISQRTYWIGGFFLGNQQGEGQSAWLLLWAGDSIDKDSIYILFRITVLCVCEGLMCLMPQITSASTTKHHCSKIPAWAVTQLLSKSHLFSCYYLRALPRAGKTSGDPQLTKQFLIAGQCHRRDQLRSGQGAGSLGRN